MEPVPDHSSVAVVTGGADPPKANAAVCVPAFPKLSLAVFKLFTSDQVVPFQVSVFAVLTVAVSPPKPSAKV